MNAITLLSGWSHQRGQHQPLHQRPGSRRPSRGSSNDRIVEGGGAIADSEVQHGGEEDSHNASTSPILGNSAPSTSTPVEADKRVGSNSSKDDLAHLLKPPEAAAYENIEAEAVAATSSNPSLGLHLGPQVDPAALYPTPPATPQPELASDGEHQLGSAAEQAPESSTKSSRATNELVPSSSGTLLGEKASRPRGSSQSHDAARPSQQQRRLSDRQTRQLARSFPMQCIVRIYMTMRRFFALFGVQLDPMPGLTGGSNEQPRLEAPVAVLQDPQIYAQDNADAPPSYSDATRPPDTAPAEALPRTKRYGRWRFGSLMKRKSASAAPASDDLPLNGDTYGSSSDEWSGDAESKLVKRKDKESATGEKPASAASARGHTKATLSRTSIAQVALSKPKLLVLDLDETLIHSTSRMHYASGAVTSSVDPNSRSAWNANTSGLKVRVVEVVLDGRSVIYHVYKRPWVDFFLRKVSAWYTVVIFTASLQEYADPVIDWLDQDRGMIHSRLFRESCTYVNGSYVKDLSIIDKDLARVCLVDNSPISYAINQANGIPIEGWINDPNDEALLDLLPMLDSLRFTNDVRHVLALRLATTSTQMPSSGAKVRRRRTSTIVNSDAVQRATAQRAAEDMGTGMKNGVKQV